jgi:hypothetical protein
MLATGTGRQPAKYRMQVAPKEEVSVAATWRLGDYGVPKVSMGNGFRAHQSQKEFLPTKTCHPELYGCYTNRLFRKTQEISHLIAN